MDGNGRWAEAPRLPRTPVTGGVRPVAQRRELRAPRRRSADAVRVLERELAAARGARSASLMSCSWKRSTARSRSSIEGVRIRFIGDLACAAACGCSARMAAAEELTAANHGAEPPGRGRLRRALGHRAGRARLAERSAPAARCRRGNRRSALASELALGRPARSRPVHPHRRRAAHQQFPALESRVHRALLLRHAVAGFRRRMFEGALA